MPVIPAQPIFDLRIFTLAMVTLFTVSSAFAAHSNTNKQIQELKKLSIQELLEVPVTSVSRRSQPYADAAAALYVISREDIRRSSATALPELLRMVPGLQVAHIDANKWAISARGFNGRYANKLLVQMDGRTLYSNLYSGVYWDVQTTILEDIERIEVIRGPGATLWGANAVNGVINIITRSAHDTHGGLLVAGVGNEEKGSMSLRYGGSPNDNSSFRLFAKGFKRDAGLGFDGHNANDDWRDQRVGFRADMELSADDSLSVQGEYYDGEAGANVLQGRTEINTQSDTSGAHLLANWSRELGPNGGRIELKAYYDHTERSSWVLKEKRDTYDLDFQHQINIADDHNLVWGAGYRKTRDDIRTRPGSPLSFAKAARNLSTFSAFIQDETSFYDTELNLIVGSKIEHNDYTGWQIQPNIRGLWNFADNGALWAAVSHAVRTPSRVESDVSISAGPVMISGDSDLQAERMTAYELGLRIQPANNLSLDITSFYNNYDRLQTFETTSPDFAFPIRQQLDNKMQANSYGLELSANWDVTNHWRMRAAYSWFKLNLDLDSESNDSISLGLWDRAPRNQLHLQSLMDLRHDLELDTSLYYTDQQPSTETDSHVQLDIRLGWRPTTDLELNLIGKNLLDDAHSEFTEFSGSAGAQGLISSQVERSFFVQAKWRF